MIRWLFLLPLLFLIPGIAFSACNGYVTNPQTSGATVGQLADKGKLLYAAYCAGCHGNRGQGITAPALMGVDTHLDHFDTARDLHEYIRTTMPFNKPGSLSDIECNHVTCFLIAENKLVTRDTVFDINGIKLEHDEAEKHTK